MGDIVRKDVPTGELMVPLYFFQRHITSMPFCDFLTPYLLQKCINLAPVAFFNVYCSTFFAFSPIFPGMQ